MSEAAQSFSQSDALPFRPANLGDVDALVRLINAAFRVERPFIEGHRIDAEGVRSYTWLVASTLKLTVTAAIWACLAWTLSVKEPGSAAG